MSDDKFRCELIVSAIRGFASRPGMDASATGAWATIAADAAIAEMKKTESDPKPPAERGIHY